MEIHRYNCTLSVHDIQELSAANARWFRNQVCASLAPELKRIDIDLSKTCVVDSCGLSALMSLYKAANHQNQNGGVAVRLLNPLPPVQQLFEVMRIHHLFEIVPLGGESANLSVEVKSDTVSIIPVGPERA